MPVFLVPRHVSAHRASAIALYRALLTQSRATPLPSQSRKELQNIVRNRFKQTVNLHSYRRLQLAFQAGYQALDLLDGAVKGNAPSRAESRGVIEALLRKAPGNVKSGSEPSAAQSALRKGKSKKTSVDDGTLSEASTSTATADQLSSLSPPPSIFARPLPLSQLSGPRHVPVLFSANSIPVLRFKKPQPEALSGFIKNRVRQRQRRHDRRHWLAEQVEFARYEDLWDGILERETGIKDEDGQGASTWAEEFETAKEEVDWAIREEGRKNFAMARRMQEVVDRETEMAARERRERMEVKAREKKERRSAAKAAADGAAVPVTGGHEDG